jgi:hypothetical protein
MRFRFHAIVLFALIAPAALLHASGLPPNRGTQLFLLIQKKDGQTHIIAMKPRREVIQEWNRCTGTYDFIRAEVRSARDGSAVSFTRYVMKEDYAARVQRLDLRFPYVSQPHYRFFDMGSIVGFYRNSPDDIDARKLFWPERGSEL